MHLALTHGGVYVRRYPNQDVLSASSLEAVTELADDARFAKKVPQSQVFARSFLGDGLFTAEDDEPNWAKAHDLLMPALANSAMRRYHPSMVTVSKRLIATWDRAAESDRAVPVSDDMTRMTLDSIGLAGFGFDFESFSRDEPHPFTQALVRCLAYCQTKEAAVSMGVDISDQDEAFARDSAYLASVVDEVIESRIAEGSDHTDDLLGVMLQAEHPATGSKLSATNTRYQVITMLAAGHETTAGSLGFALHLLVNHPEVLERVRAEVDGLWGDAEEPEPSFEDVGRLTYLRQVVFESLRLWPSGFGFTRQAREDTTLLGRHPMKAGDWAIVLTPVLHRDPAAWGDNPNAFDPDNFSPQREAARSIHAFKPFGTGERACIGRQFALHEMVLLLGMLVHRYRFLDHESYQLRLRQALTVKPDGFSLKLARRTPADRADPMTRSRPAPDAGEELSADDALPSRARPGSRLTVLYGSNLGTCRELADGLADLAGELGFECALAPLGHHADRPLPRSGAVVIVAASYNGRPTDDASAFVTRLESARGGGLADGVRYAVLGVGDRNWASTYQRVPKLLDDLLASAGGEKLMERAELDAGGDLAGAWARTTGQLRRVLLTAYGDRDSPTGAERGPTHAHHVREVTGASLDLLAERHELTAMTVTETGDLADLGHPLGRAKRFVRLALPPGTTYRSGDHLAVLPANAPAGVERAVRLLGADPETVLNIRPQRPGRGTLPIDRPLTVRQLLTHYLELQEPARAQQIEVLAALNPCPPEQAALKQLPPGSAGVLDLIESHPALIGRLDWDTVLDLLPQMRVRHYSISSSPAVSPDHVDLMVSTLEAPRRDGEGTYLGTCSGHLSRIGRGDTVLARVAPCRDAFQVRDDAPAVMVAAGTGLAPFRGAVADRVHRLGGGEDVLPALLYFGCDHPQVDYLHAEELTRAEQAGAVSLRPAFSRAPEAGARYVQHRIAAESDEVWHLLEDGAVVYVCGDADRMAPGVRGAFEELHSRRTGSAPEVSAQWLAALMAEGRYVEDIYGTE